MKRPALPRRFIVFLAASAILIGGVAVGTGATVGRFFERYVVSEEAEETAEATQHVARQHLTSRSFQLPVPAEETPNIVRFMESLPGVFRIKIYALSGHIAWANEPRLIGQQFASNENVARSLRGEMVTTLKRPLHAEHVYERNRRYIAEVYTPIRLRDDARIVGVVETYRDMTEAMALVAATKRRVWGWAAGAGVLLYGALAFVVWTALDRERRAIRRLEDHNRDLTLLQSFTGAALGRLDVKEVAAELAVDVGLGLELAATALYRVHDGGVELVAGWPAAAAARADMADAAAVAAREGTRIERGGVSAHPVPVPGHGMYVFAGVPAAQLDAEQRQRTLGIMLDETSLVLANAEGVRAIREAHERLAAIVAAITDEMVILDGDMRVVWTNPAAAATRALGTLCYDHVGAPVANDVCENCPAIRTLGSGTVERGVRAQPLPGGLTRYIDLVTVPLSDASGRVVRVLEVARDITDLVEMEIQLKEANRALVETQSQLVEKERLAAIGEVVVGLHHAVLNPLTGVLGALEVLKSDVSADDRPRFIAEATAEIRKIEHLIRSLATTPPTTSTSYVGGTRMLDLAEPQ